MKLHGFKASPRAKRKTAGLGFWTTTPPFAHADRPLMWQSGQLEESLLERKVVRTLAARWSSWLLLAENVEIDGALVANSNDCFVQGVQHYHGLQPLAGTPV